MDGDRRADVAPGISTRAGTIFTPQKTHGIDRKCSATVDGKDPQITHSMTIHDDGAPFLSSSLLLVFQRIL